MTIVKPARHISIGCQSWGYDDWVTPAGANIVFYPAGTKRGEMLEFYSRVFDTIEVDSTMYGIPAASTLEKWHRETPEGFTFSLKFPRQITHDMGLSQDSIEAAREFAERAHVLGDKLAMLLIQLPPSFDGRRENAQNLRRFLETLPAGPRYAIEFRNSDWFIDWTYQELERTGVSLALVEGPWVPRETMFDAATRSSAPYAYVRIMGERDLERFDRIYRHRDGRLAEWAAVIDGLAAQDVFIYCDNYFEGFAPGTAAKLQRLFDIEPRRPEDHLEQPALF